MSRLSVCVVSVCVCSVDFGVQVIFPPFLGFNETIPEYVNYSTYIEGNIFIIVFVCAWYY